jgi:hypothetical protein
MSRGPVARSKAIAEQLPGSLVTLARIDIRAQNHAVVEGAADPFPAPVLHARGNRPRATPPNNTTQGGRVAKLPTPVPSAYYADPNRLDRAVHLKRGLEP